MLKSLLNKVSDLEACNFIKKRLQHGCFLGEICESFKNNFSTATAVSIYKHAIRYTLRSYLNHLYESV